jgi:hypothetical protein
MKKGTGRSRRRAQPDAARIDHDETLPEYDFRGGKQNRFAGRIREGATVVQLDPDVAAAFPDAASVNNALRALAGIIQQHATSPSSRRPRAAKRGTV